MLLELALFISPCTSLTSQTAFFGICMNQLEMESCLIYIFKHLRDIIASMVSSINVYVNLCCTSTTAK